MLCRLLTACAGQCCFVQKKERATSCQLSSSSQCAPGLAPVQVPVAQCDLRIVIVMYSCTVCHIGVASTAHQLCLGAHGTESFFARDRELDVFFCQSCYVNDYLQTGCLHASETSLLRLPRVYYVANWPTEAHSRLMTRQYSLTLFDAMQLQHHRNACAEDAGT